MTDQLPDQWPDEVEAAHSRWLPRLLGRLSSPRMLHDKRALRRAVQGRTVVITGASSGLGLATARHCGRAGATVVICARSTDKLEEVAERIRQEGGSAYAYTCDLADPDSVRDFATYLLREHGHVDVLVHNAGKSLNRPIDLSYRRPKDLEATAGVNYLGPVRLTLMLLPYMRARGEGHIVNISTAGLLMYPGAGWGFYLGSKAAFEWWLRAVALEARADGVTVTQHYLGAVRTKMSAPKSWLHSAPSQSADEAAWGVARSIAKRPRYSANWAFYLISAGAGLVRVPVDIAIGLQRKLAPPKANEYSTGRARPQEEFVMGDPQEFERARRAGTLPKAGSDAAVPSGARP